MSIHGSLEGGKNFLGILSYTPSTNKSLKVKIYPDPHNHPRKDNLILVDTYHDQINVANQGIDHEYHLY